jgi:hypothetical protein
VEESREAAVAAPAAAVQSPTPRITSDNEGGEVAVAAAVDAHAEAEPQQQEEQEGEEEGDSAGPALVAATSAETRDSAAAVPVFGGPGVAGERMVVIVSGPYVSEAGMAARVMLDEIDKKLVSVWKKAAPGDRQVSLLAFVSRSCCSQVVQVELEGRGYNVNMLKEKRSEFADINQRNYFWGEDRPLPVIVPAGLDAAISKALVQEGGAKGVGACVLVGPTSSFRYPLSCLRRMAKREIYVLDFESVDEADLHYMSHHWRFSQGTGRHVETKVSLLVGPRS